MRKIFAALALAAVAGTTGGVAAAATTPDPYVTRVTGTARTGFHLHYSDHDTVIMDSRRQQMQECGLFRKATAVAHCRGEVDARLTWVAIMKQSLNHTK